jgi:hypothetical protein
VNRLSLPPSGRTTRIPRGSIAPLRSRGEPPPRDEFQETLLKPVFIQGPYWNSTEGPKSDVWAGAVRAVDGGAAAAASDRGLGCRCGGAHTRHAQLARSPLHNYRRIRFEAQFTSTGKDDQGGFMIPVSISAWQELICSLSQRWTSPSELSASPSELLASPSELLASPSESS